MMTEKTLSIILKRIDLKKCEIIVPGRVAYIKKRTYIKGDKSNRVDEFFVILDGNIVVGGIHIMGNYDLFWIIFEEHRGKHFLSDALKQGIVAKKCPELKEINCYHNTDKNEYEKTCYLASLANVKVRNEYEEPFWIKKFKNN